MSRRPRIAINMGYHRDDVRLMDRHQLSAPYVRAIVEAGGLPLPIPCVGDEALLREALALADGVLLTGGPDYPPKTYGVAKIHPQTNLVAPERTRADLLLGRLLVTEIRLPVLGICLGHQLLYVAHGGRLIQHLPRAAAHRWLHPGRDRTHRVRIAQSSRLHGIFGVAAMTVNSAHHQGADPDFLPPALAIMARAGDGTVEAVESHDRSRWLVGVQWHPERIRDAHHRRTLFGAFLAACGENL